MALRRITIEYDTDDCGLDSDYDGVGEEVSPLFNYLENEFMNRGIIANMQEHDAEDPPSVSHPLNAMTIPGGMSELFAG